MKRLAAVISAIFLLFAVFAFPTHAAETVPDSAVIYAECIPPKARGTLFYIDIYSEPAVSAAKLIVRYDGSIAEYRGVSAERSTSDVKAKDDNGSVSLVFCDRGAVSGKLMSLGFNMLSEGSADIVISAVEVLDAELASLTDVPEFTLSLSLTKNTVVTRGTKSESKGSSSEKTASPDSVTTLFRELTPSDEKSWFFLGAGAVALVVLLLGAGYAMGKRRREPKKAAPAPETPAPDNEDADTDSDVQ